MADVHVTTINKSGQKAVLLLDDERDEERIAHLKKLGKLEKLKSVTVKAAPKSGSRAAAAPAATD